MKILLVDDDATIRLILSTALRRVGGFDVVEADTLAAAAAQLAEQPFDAVLTDVQLPDGRGDALVAPVRRSTGGSAPDTPVFAVTATTDPVALAALHANGVRAVFQKPFDPFTLATSLRQQLKPPGDAP